jgi:hypothetical protein
LSQRGAKARGRRLSRLAAAAARPRSLRSLVFVYPPTTPKSPTYLAHHWSRGHLFSGTPPESTHTASIRLRLDKPSSSHHFQAQSEHARTLQRDGVAPAHPAAAGRLSCAGRAIKRLALCPPYLVSIHLFFSFACFSYLLCVHGWVLHYQ